MKFKLSIFLIAFVLVGCGEQFDSKRPWDNVVAEGSLIQGSVSEAALSSVVNNFVKEEAAGNYYFEEVVLSDGVNSLAIYKSVTQGKLFSFSILGTQAATYDGTWSIKMNRATKEAYILLEKYSGEKMKIFADNTNGEQFFLDEKLFKKTNVESSEMGQISNRFCKMNVKNAGGELRKLIELSMQVDRSSSIDFSNCIQIFKDYINESRDLSIVDNDSCKNINKKYKALTRVCKI